MAWTTDADGNQYQLDDYAEPQTDAQVLYSNDGYGDTGSGNYTDENQDQSETDRLARLNNGTDGLGNISPGSDTVGGDSGWSWDKIAKQLGITKADGSYDLKKILALTGAGVGVVGALTDKPQTIASISTLKAGMPGQSAMNTTGWTPEQLAFGQRPMQTGSALQRVYAADMPSTITPGKTSRQYAEGGDVQGALTQAFAGPVQSSVGGQDDLIDVKVAGGEFIFDADSVSAAGDGNTEAGFKKLEELRQQLRAQKRSAPVNEIPQQVQGPLSNMMGAQ